MDNLSIAGDVILRIAVIVYIFYMLVKLAIRGEQWAQKRSTAPRNVEPPVTEEDEGGINFTLAGLPPGVYKVNYAIFRSRHPFRLVIDQDGTSSWQLRVLGNPQDGHPPRLMLSADGGETFGRLGDQIFAGDAELIMENVNE